MLAVTHLAIVASIFAYGVLLAIVRAPQRSEPLEPSRIPEWGLLLFGFAQYAAVTSWTRRRLASGRGNPQERVRTHFILRFAAAEAIGVFGFVLGLRGGSLFWAIGLFAASVLALAAAAPTREAYENAMARAAPGMPGGSPP